MRQQRSPSSAAGGSARPYSRACSAPAGARRPRSSSPSRRGTGRRAARALRRRGDGRQRRGRRAAPASSSSPSSRRTSTPCSSRSAPSLTPEQTVVSVAAAIPTAHIEERIADGVPVVRAMPNAPATVHEGMAGICAGAHAGDEQLALAEELLCAPRPRRPRARVVDGRDHRGLRLRARPTSRCSPRR